MDSVCYKTLRASSLRENVVWHVTICQQDCYEQHSQRVNRHLEDAIVINSDDDIDDDDIISIYPDGEDAGAEHTAAAKPEDFTQIKEVIHKVCVVRECLNTGNGAMHFTSPNGRSQTQGAQEDDDIDDMETFRSHSKAKTAYQGSPCRRSNRAA